MCAYVCLSLCACIYVHVERVVLASQSGFWIQVTAIVSSLDPTWVTAIVSDPGGF